MKTCDCKSIDNYSKDPEVPISYDSKFNEYSINFVSDNGGKVFLRYCFSCGGALPESKRCDYFTNPDETLIVKYKNMLKDVKNADDIICILGEPDSQIDLPSIREEDKEIYGMKQQKRQFDYEKLSDSFILSVSEYIDGTFDYVFFGKQID